MFERMLGRVRDQMVEYVFRVQLPPVVRRRPEMEPQAVPAGGGAQARPPAAAAAKKQENKFSNLKVGRNDPCPCGSGKKYKKCHGAG